jgi:hypothetical protein
VVAEPQDRDDHRPDVHAGHEGLAVSDMCAEAAVASARQAALRSANTGVGSAL